MTRLRLCAAAAALAAAVMSAHAVDLTIEISGARSDAGMVYAAAYADAAGWLKPDRFAASARAAAAEGTVVLRGLAPGRYAVSAFHDENGNGRLDTNVVGLPLEPYGFSRDARGTMGPPAFDAAVVDAQANTTIRLVLH